MAVPVTCATCGKAAITTEEGTSVDSDGKMKVIYKMIFPCNHVRTQRTFDTSKSPVPGIRDTHNF